MMHSFEMSVLEMAARGLPMSVIARHIGCSRQAVRRLMYRAYASLHDDEPDCDGATQAEAREADDDLG